MGWKMSHLSSSLMGMLRQPEQGTGTPSQMEHIRGEMLACLAGHLQDPARNRVKEAGRVRQCSQSQTVVKDSTSAWIQTKKK